MIKELTTLYADKNILYFNEDYGNVVCPSNKKAILNKNPNNINLIIILMKMILILLFVSDFQFGILHLIYAKYLEKS